MLTIWLDYFVVPPRNDVLKSDNKKGCRCYPSCY